MTLRRLPALAAALSLLLPPAGAMALSLQQCLDAASRHAPALEAATANVSRADAAIREARAALAPTLRLGASYVQLSEAPKTLISVPALHISETLNTGTGHTVSVRTEAGYTLYSGGRDPALVRAAEAAREGQQLSRDQVGADLALRVSNAYYRELSAKRLVLATREALDAARSHLATARARVDAGASPKLDQLRAQVDESRRSTAAARAEEARRLARVELESAIGTALDPADTLESAPDPDAAEPDSAAALVRALAARPELRQLEQGLRELDARRDATRAGHRPQLQLGALAEYRGPNLDDQYMNLGDPGLKTYNLSATLSMSLPLLDGGLVSSRVAELDAQRAQLEAARRDMVLGVRRELQTALSGLRVARAVWQANDVRLAAAREGLRLASAAYREGAGTATDVRDAETALADARAEEAQSLADYWTARAALDHAVGAHAPAAAGGN